MCVCVRTRVFSCGACARRIDRCPSADTSSADEPDLADQSTRHVYFRDDFVLALWVLHTVRTVSPH
ncbi:hypothetical protein C0Q70_05391 [Pomacea canaliculata]|uniref:Uncharacterized protein n=1 Tax=Pomacea canaliculata TaxID=400727 RepID=A0A2T7PL35_POMCA|nr:hypothetical protein C0Q70_05391 [Pomacea canaliculata]